MNDSGSADQGNRRGPGRRLPGVPVGRRAVTPGSGAEPAGAAPSETTSPPPPSFTPSANTPVMPTPPATSPPPTFLPSAGESPSAPAPLRRPLRHRARAAMAATSPPTEQFSAPRRTSSLPLPVERDVLDLVVRMGEALIGTGAAVADTTVDLLRMAAGFGVTNCHIDITFISITATIDRSDDPLTKVRIISVRTADYSRLTDLHRMIDDVATGKLTLLDAQSRFDQIVTSPHSYRRWIVTVALGVMGASIAGLLGGGILVALVAGLTSAAIDRVLRFFRRRNLPYLFQQVIGAGMATLVAMLLMVGRDMLGWPAHLLPPSVVVGAGMVVLLAGLSLVGAAGDAIQGYPLTAAARSFEVVLNTIGLVAGIGVMLNLARAIGIPLVLNESMAFQTSVWVQAACGGVAAAAWGVASYGRLRTVMLMLAIGAGSTAVRWGAIDLGMGFEASAFVAAMVVGLAAVAVGERTRTPSLVLSIAGLTPLLPGLAIYRGMFALVEGDHVLAGSSELIGAFMIGLALAAGVTLGGYLATPLRRRIDRFNEMVGVRARGARN
ncbi:threonine/serine ThrE exporter family protein [Pseudactinotalea sp. Z1732]|uniref:threonine/serine ThrE exporter family protein n=1 Tax=Micrococcales TaxID=85006 RepID=UPI003C7BD8FD